MEAITAGTSPTVTFKGDVNAVGHQVPPHFIFLGNHKIAGLLKGLMLGASGTVSDSRWWNTAIFQSTCRTI